MLRDTDIVTCYDMNLTRGKIFFFKKKKKKTGE